MDQKPSSKDRLREITERIEQGIQELFTSEKYCNYLRTMSRFHRYSVNNTMLIYMQRPDATLVAGYGKWRDQFKLNVLRGEKGIKIIAPAPYKKTILAEKLDPLTRIPIRDSNGKTVTEEREITIPMFKPVTVFDISQTEGEPLPELAETLTGDVKEFSTFMEALRRSSPVPICMEDMPQFMDGYFQMKEQRIAIRKGMSEVQTIAAAIHEIAHAKLHDNTKTQIGERKDQRTAEVEAESIAYAVCAYYDIHTEANSFGYIASWSKGKDLQTLRDSLETINNTCSELIDDIDRHFAEIVKEAEKDMPDPSVSKADMHAYGYHFDGMLPLLAERAKELYEANIEIFRLYEDDTEGAVWDAVEFEEHDGLFGIEQEAWDRYRQSTEKQEAEQNKHKCAERER